MKGILRNIGVLGLACASFLLTDETIQVVKEKDDLMIEIKEMASNYHIGSIDAKISDKYIKIGLNGLALDIDETYKKMKRIGYFNENMIVYQNVKPNVTVTNYKDHIINGNSKNEVSLIFVNPKNIDKIIDILRHNNLKATFIIDDQFYKNNVESIELLLNYKSDLGFIDDYKKLKKELPTNYVCYSNLLNECYKDNKYTIEATYEINDLKDLKTYLKPGSIILINETNYLDVYIKYILSRGYKIENISNFINEEIN